MKMPDDYRRDYEERDRSVVVILGIVAVVVVVGIVIIFL